MFFQGSQNSGSLPQQPAIDPQPFTLVNVYKHESWQFFYFPTEIETASEANWEPQNTTIGVKPLFYMNREPTSLTINDLLLDGSLSGKSITPQIKRLRALQEETAKGTPSTLIALWGDRQETVVLKTLTIREQFFAPQGFPLRARVNLALIQIQDQNRVNIVEDDDLENSTRPRRTQS